MGAEPYCYFVDYEDDVAQALSKLRRAVFQCGQFRGGERRPATPEAALEQADEGGTASILDIVGISAAPEIFHAAPWSDEDLEDYFGTSTPTQEAIERCTGFWSDMERGEARYIVVYQGDVPVKYFFAGYSFD